MPAAIDRAVMLPYGLGLEDADQAKRENGDETAGETTVQGSGMGTATQTITKSESVKRGSRVETEEAGTVAQGQGREDITDEGGRENGRE